MPCDSKKYHYWRKRGRDIKETVKLRIKRLNDCPLTKYHFCSRARRGRLGTAWDSLVWSSIEGELCHVIAADILVGDISVSIYLLFALLYSCTFTSINNFYEKVQGKLSTHVKYILNTKQIVNCIELNIIILGTNNVLQSLIFHARSWLVYSKIYLHAPYRRRSAPKNWVIFVKQ